MKTTNSLYTTTAYKVLINSPRETIIQTQTTLKQLPNQRNIYYSSQNHIKRNRINEINAYKSKTSTQTIESMKPITTNKKQRLKINRNDELHYFKQEAT